jgi:hypothetical protein
MNRFLSVKNVPERTFLTSEDTILARIADRVLVPVLVTGVIYDAHHCYGLRCHDILSFIKIDKGIQAILRGRFNNLNGSIVGVTDGKVL